MTIQEMKQKKKELGYSNAMVAALSGVPLGTVQKIFSGATTTPRYETLRALEQAFKLSPGASSPASPTNPVSGASFLTESILAYSAKQQGEFTLEDYYNLPEEERFELIDGVIYDMTAPTSAHQLIAGYFHYQFFNHIMSRNGDCLPMISPLDVQLNCDDRTMVQPDVIIVCDRSKVIDRCIYGAPDFVLEVLSKSTKRKDMIIKLNKYMNAGVREYWMIDPEQKTVMVYDFEHDHYAQFHDFKDTIPVTVLDTQCQIDLTDLYEHIRFLYERE